MRILCAHGATKNIWRNLRSGGGLLGTKYPADVLRRELAKAIGAERQREAKTKVMVTSMTHQREAVMIKSWLPEWGDLPMEQGPRSLAGAKIYPGRINSH